MRWKSRQRRGICLVIACLLATTVIAAAKASASGSETFTGRVIDLGGALPGLTSAHFTLHIDEYSDIDEVRGHLAVLAEQGQDGLTKALRKLDRGWMRVGTHLGYPISVARSFETDNGRVIRAITDRPIQMLEVMHGLRSRDYTLGVLEITLGVDGTGEGRLIPAAKIRFNKDGAVEIESLGTQPFRLMNVRSVEEKKKN